MTLAMCRQFVAKHRDALIFALAGTLIPVAYIAYTHHVWEDWFITFRHSENLCKGNGLVYNIGERVHGFTSPLGVILPAICYLATGERSYVPALWLFRAMCIAAYVTAGVILLRRIGREDPYRSLMKLFLAVLYLSDVKSVAYTVNGMETAFMLCFVAWGVALLERGHASAWLARSFCWAGLLWTRPDGCVYIGVLAAASLLFAPERRGPMLFSILKSGTIAALLYMPWFAWTWYYYGSPIPQTVHAKGLSTPSTLIQRLPEIMKGLPDQAGLAFNAIYWPFWRGTPGWFAWFSYAAGLFCCVYWLLPLRDRLGRAASLCFVCLCLYLSVGFFVYPWYLPPVSLFGWIVLASGIFCLTRQIMPFHLSGVAACAVLLVLCIGNGSIFALTSRLMRVQEREIEIGNRLRIGRWLEERVAPGESVYLEPIGHIGYFSHAKILDWPGLVSPSVVRAREKGADFDGVIDKLQPDWAVVRPGEVGNLLKGYDPVAVFNIRPRLEKYASMPGYRYVFFDAAYVIFRKSSLSPRLALSDQDRQRATQLIYPMLVTGPTRIEGISRKEKVNDKDVLLVHAEGAVRFDVPANSHSVSGKYGIIPEAYEKGDTDGVVFRVEYEPAQGKPQVLFERNLDPKKNASDRGMHDLTVALPKDCRGSLVLRTTNAPGKQTAWDWSYWTAVEVK
jgi:hypothetical protein